MSEEDGRAQSEAYGKLTEEMRSSGVFRAGEGLQPATTATTVRVPNGERIVTDGPFAETKEQLGGFYVVDCKDLDEAIELGREDPDGQERMRRGSPGHPVRQRPSVEVDRLFRQESGRAVATLIRLLGDFDLAEEAVQDAWLVALERWPARGHPAQSGRVDHHHRTQPRHRPASGARACWRPSSPSSRR